MDKSVAETDEQAKLREEQVQQAEELQRELDALRTRSEVDRQSLELVRREMVAQKQYTTGLEEDLRFYRSLMSPESAKGQLKVREPEIVPSASAGQYTYRVLLYQQTAKHQLVRGDMIVTVHGLQEGKSAEHTFAAIGEPGGEQWPVVKFRYFQEFAGTLVLPPGFEPDRIEVAVAVNKPRKIEVREEFPWRIMEEFSDVGQ